MIYKEMDYCIAGVNFNVSINDEFFEQINEYMEKSLGGNHKTKTCFPKQIYYIVDEVEFSKKCILAMSGELDEKIECFKDEYCYRNYIDDEILIREEQCVQLTLNI